MPKIWIGLFVATAAEVTGIVYWLILLSADSHLMSFIALVSGEAVEWLLLAALIIQPSAQSPVHPNIGMTLFTTASIIFSESLLWFLWFFCIERLGFDFATVLLLVLMHLKHGAAVSVYTGRPLSADIFDVSSIVATVLEVGGAAAFYKMFSSGSVTAGIVLLAVGITLEHSLQFRAAGLFTSNGKTRIVS